jgi:hypothetical protein
LNRPCVCFAPSAEELDVRVALDRPEGTETDATDDVARRWTGVDHADTKRLQRELRSFLDTRF